MKDAEIWRIANDMIREYGADAENYARSRAETLRQQGIPDGAEDWTRVAEAIAELSSRKLRKPHRRSQYGGNRADRIGSNRNRDDTKTPDG